MRSLIVLLCCIITLSSLVVNGYQAYKYDDMYDRFAVTDSALSAVKYELKNTRREADTYKKFFDEFQERKNSIARKGYSVDELVVFYLTQKFIQMEFISKAWVDSVQGKESSFWLQTDGALGEVGGFQLMPSFVEVLYKFLGVDPTGIYMKQAGELKTNTDLAYFAFWLMRMHEIIFGVELSWENYNNGDYLRVWMQLISHVDKNRSLLVELQQDSKLKLGR